MPLAQEQEVVLQTDSNRFVLGKGLDHREGAIDRTVQCRVGAPVQFGHFDQDAHLRDQLGPEHQDLLIVDVAGF